MSCGKFSSTTSSYIVDRQWLQTLYRIVSVGISLYCFYRNHFLHVWLIWLFIFKAYLFYLMLSSISIGKEIKYSKKTFENNVFKGFWIKKINESRTLRCKLRWFQLIIQSALVGEWKYQLCCQHRKLSILERMR